MTGKRATTHNENALLVVGDDLEREHRVGAVGVLDVARALDAVLALAANSVGEEVSKRAGKYVEGGRNAPDDGLVELHALCALRRHQVGEHPEIRNQACEQYAGVVSAFPRAYSSEWICVPFDGELLPAKGATYSVRRDRGRVVGTASVPFMPARAELAPFSEVHPSGISAANRSARMDLPLPLSDAMISRKVWSANL